jgi:hypothetical protein
VVGISFPSAVLSSKNFSRPAGEMITRNLAGVVPAFLKVCGIPLGAKTNDLGGATMTRSPTLNSNSPSRTKSSHPLDYAGAVPDPTLAAQCLL